MTSSHLQTLPQKSASSISLSLRRSMDSFKSGKTSPLNKQDILTTLKKMERRWSSINCMHWLCHFGDHQPLLELNYVGRRLMEDLRLCQLLFGSLNPSWSPCRCVFNCVLVQSLFSYSWTTGRSRIALSGHRCDDHYSWTDALVKELVVEKVTGWVKEMKSLTITEV